MSFKTLKKEFTNESQLPTIHTSSLPWSIIVQMACKSSATVSIIPWWRHPLTLWQWVSLRSGMPLPGMGLYGLWHNKSHTGLPQEILTVLKLQEIRCPKMCLWLPQYIKHCWRHVTRSHLSKYWQDIRYTYTSQCWATCLS